MNVQSQSRRSACLAPRMSSRRPSIFRSPACTNSDLGEYRQLTSSRVDQCGRYIVPPRYLGDTSPARRPRSGTPNRFSSFHGRRRSAPENTVICPSTAPKRTLKSARSPHRQGRPRRLSITHKWFAGELDPKLDVHESGPTSPHDHVAGRRIVSSTEIAAQARDLS